MKSGLPLALGVVAGLTIARSVVGKLARRGSRGLDRRDTIALMVEHGAVARTYRDLDESARRSLANYYGEYGGGIAESPDVWHMDPKRNDLHHGREWFLRAEIPTPVMKAEALRSLEDRWPDWESYHRHYLKHAVVPHHGPENRWTVLLSGDPEDEFPFDGWHRFHSYVRDGHATIPAVLHLRERDLGMVRVALAERKRASAAKRKSPVDGSRAVMPGLPALVAAVIDSQGLNVGDSGRDYALVHASDGWHAVKTEGWGPECLGDVDCPSKALAYRRAAALAKSLLEEGWPNAGWWKSGDEEVWALTWATQPVDPAEEDHARMIEHDEFVDAR